MNHITVEEPNKRAEFCKRIKSRTEDLLFSIIELLPERFIPGCAMKWLNSYLDKRMKQLMQEQIQANWNKVYIEKAVDELKRK